MLFRSIIRESSDKQLVLRIVKALPFIHQPDRVAPKASDVQQLIGYINTSEKYDIFNCQYFFSPQTKFFVLMINDLDVNTSHLWKFVDDTTASDVVPKGNTSNAQSIVNQVIE